MKCACSVDFELSSADGPEESECHELVAASNHRCCECQRSIEPGEVYEHYKGMYDDKWYTYDTCSDCLSIRNVFFANGYYFGEVLEYFYEFINDNGGQISEKCLSALTPRAREMACERIQEIWF